jgi:hypothetical protein
MTKPIIVIAIAVALGALLGASKVSVGTILAFVVLLSFFAVPALIGAALVKYLRS